MAATGLTRPTPPTTAKSARPDTVEATETVLAICIGTFALMLIALALPDLLQTGGRQMRLHYALFVFLIPALTVAAMVPTKHGSLRRVFAGTAAWMILLGFLLWHLGLLGNGLSPDARPWSWGIAGAGVGLAAVARNIIAAFAYGLAFSGLVLIIPLLPAGSARLWADSWQDALLTAAMTLVIVAPIWALRLAVRQQDQAAVDAVEKFTEAARSEAESLERMRLDALTHDVILSTLIVASQATSREVQDAAARAAKTALVQLEMVKHDAETTDDGYLAMGEWLARLKDATGGAAVELAVTQTPAREEPLTQIPILVARALTSAASEAVRNAAEHAPGSAIRINISVVKPKIAVQVVDDGPGFDINDVPMERMGVRVSILEMMRGAGGRADIDGSNGTTVTLAWDGGDDGSVN